MRCRSCGTEIADKAIVCYRCGASTTDPVRAPAPRTRRRSPLFSLAVAVLLVLLALYMGQASRFAANPGRWQTLAVLLAGVAVTIVFLRLIRRR
jgi:glycerol uptake facilitator-like aquaporin